MSTNDISLSITTILDELQYGSKQLTMKNNVQLAKFVNIYVELNDFYCFIYIYTFILDEKISIINAGFEKPKSL